MDFLTGRLHLNAKDFRLLLQEQGPSLALWRAAEVAALREHVYHRPILDLGCGDGFVMSIALPKIDIGLDPDTTALAKAQARKVYAQLHAATAEACAIEDQSIGTVISNSVLEHLSGVDDVLRRIARMLRPGGRLIFTAPTQWFGRWLLLPFERYARWRNQQLLHLNLWDLNEWQRRLRAAGFEVEKLRSYLRPGLVRIWDALELPQLIEVGGRQPFGAAWKHLPGGWIGRLAHHAARLDLSAPPDGGGGSLIVARRV